MLFSSLEFIFLFLPLSIGIYFLLPEKCRVLWLFLSGLCFYAYGGPNFLPLMLLTVLLDYGFGIWIEGLCKRGRQRQARSVCILAVVYNIGQLALFKYFDPFGWGLPIGISFYTFQALSYVIDVYRRQTEANKSLIAFGAYVSLFPQLIAGPIVRYTDISRELVARSYSIEDIAEGMRRFCAGLAKKVLLANTAGQMWEIFKADTGLLGTYLAVIFFAFRIYFDFSGYSDMAIGLGRVLGFSFPENFNYPYISRSITEFWRRWHITLSAWFREYVYIVLGGNRRGRARTYLNLLITWALTGIWHGSTANFLLWGIYFAVILILEKAFIKGLLERLPRVFSHIYALLLIGIGWGIFAADEGGFAFVGRLFLIGTEGLYSGDTLYHFIRSIGLIAVCAIGCTPLPRRLYLKLRERASFADIIFPLLALVLSVAYIASSGYNPFLYFRF